MQLQLRFPQQICQLVVNAKKSASVLQCSADYFNEVAREKVKQLLSAGVQITFQVVTLK